MPKSAAFSPVRGLAGISVLEHTADIKPQVLSIGVSVDPVAAYKRGCIEGGRNAGFGGDGRGGDVLSRESVAFSPGGGPAT